MAQVRLDDEVGQVIQQRAIDSGRSLSAEANVWLRRALGLAPGELSPVAKRNRVPDPRRPAIITPPQGRGAVGRPTPGWGPR
jgi:plasmid stability protein